MDEQQFQNWRNQYERAGYTFYAPDTFTKEEKPKLLVISHQLTRTGAPLVLFDLIRIMCKEYAITVLSNCDGPLKEDLLKLHIPVVIHPEYYSRAVAFRHFAKEFDVVFANTLLIFPAITLLKDNFKGQIIWWIHEGKQFFELGRGDLPEFCVLPANIQIYAVSEQVRQVIKEEQGLVVPLLPFGIEERKADFHKQEKRIKVLIAGLYSAAKGQDLAIQLFEQMPENLQKQLEFHFVGDKKQADVDILMQVERAKKKYAQVYCLDGMSHKEYLSYMEQMDIVFVPSRFDTVSAVTMEAMMMKKLVIVSKYAGITAQLTNGKDSFIVDPANGEEEISVFEQIVADSSRVRQMAMNAFATYQSVFSFETFETRVKQVFHTAIYVFTHKKFTPPYNDDSILYIPVQVGAALHEDLGYLRDDGGEHISAKNPSYCELTGMYSLYKNVSIEGYIGVCHYRRYFINEKKQFLSANELHLAMENVDFIVPMREHVPSVKQNYQTYHYIGDLLTTKQVITEYYPDYVKAFDEVMERDFFYPGNLFITTKEQYDCYMEFLFTVLFEVEKRIDTSGYSGYQKRVFGFLSERLLSVYLLANECAVKELAVGQVVQENETKDDSYNDEDTIVIYKGNSQYNALRFFADELEKGLQKLGCPTLMLGDETDLTRFEKEYSALFNRKFRAVVSMNGVMASEKTPEGYNFQNFIDAPFYAYIVDHPYCHHQRLSQTLKDYHAICVDSTFATYVKEYYRQIKSVDVIGQGGMYAKQVVNYRERDIDVLFVGTFRNYHEIEKEIAAKTQEEQILIWTMVEYLQKKTTATLEEALWYANEQFNLGLNKRTFKELLPGMKIVDTYIRTYYREEVVRTLVEAEIHVEVYGNGWEQLVCERKEYLHTHNPVDYLEFLELIGRTKVVINVMPWAKAGIHDRICNAMLNGAVCVTDTSSYMEQIFVDEKEVVFYQLNQLEQLPKKVNALLSNQEQAEKIANEGQQYAIKHLDWEQRAKELLAIIQKEEKK